MIEIKFDPAGLHKLMFAIEKLHSMAMLEVEELPRRLATQFQYLLIYNINHATFQSGFSRGGVSFKPYEPYNTRYAAWKHTSGNFWKLEGDLIRNIVKRRSGRPKGWAVGVNDVKDAGGKSWFGKDDKGKRKSIGMYAIVNEFGGEYGRAGVHHGRPVFRPTRVEFELDNMPIEHTKSLTKLKNQWS